jgi:transcription elongation factor GreA
MTENSNISPAFDDALIVEDWDRVEELWFESLEAVPIPTSELLEVRRLLWKAGKKTLARTLLELLAESLEAADEPAQALAALREMTRLAESKPSPELLARLEASISAARNGSPSLNAVLDRVKIASSRHPLDELEVAECWLDHDCGTVVEVVGQGVGRVVELNLELENIKVDLGTPRPVSVPFGAVKRFLRLLPEGHFLRRKVEAADELAEFVASEPGEALVQILEGLSEPADVATLKAALDGVLPTSSWTSWWAKARKHPRVLASGSGSRLRYSASQSAESANETLLDELRRAAPEERLKIARQLAERSRASAEEAATVIIQSLPALETSDPGLAWQTSGLLSTLPGGEAEGKASRSRLLDQADPFQILSGSNDRNARSEALEAIADTRPDDWPEIWSGWFLRETNPILLGTIASRLEAADHSTDLERAVEVVFRNHPRHPEQFIWACESMIDAGCPEVIRRRMTPSLLETIPDALTKKEFSSVRGRAKTLLDGGQVAIRLLMESATAQQASRFSQRISRIAAVEPQRVRLVEQAAMHQRTESAEHIAPILAATKTAIGAKREELRQLLEVDIPKTLKGINAAAAEGDLRENFEYHMLRDRQELQSARAAKLQEELAVVRVLEPGAADTTSVNIGTVVHLEGERKNRVAPICILGAWDADLERRIYANGSELAQKLLGLKPGDQVELEEGTVTISHIEPWNDEG